jgi:hypothetical protein
MFQATELISRSAEIKIKKKEKAKAKAKETGKLKNSCSQPGFPGPTVDKLRVPVKEQNCIVII